ncbi:uncharacterized protein [Nerophis lumbriciformis]|uniref:uncharacterized protein isoform X1 n=1 Tax=Nerophis lumbriciformis TaxID=546530 RepID=UPI002AE00E34|nr:epithelial-stromal interaction protein 1 isoform X1 [Nerophis lumbriciformis]
MHSSRVSRHKQTLDASSEPRDRTKTLRVPPLRQNRAASCPRPPQNGGLSEVSCERRTRSSSTAPRPDGLKGKRGLHAQWREGSEGPGQRGRGGVPTQKKLAIQSHKAFTVIPPDPKKRRDIQKKADAELAALEELRLSRAMAYVTIQPSRVGGRMSLEAVRLRQQQEMMQTKRKPIRKQVVEQTHVLTG